MNLTNNQRQAINFAAAELMGLESPVNSDEKTFYLAGKFGSYDVTLYDITTNPQQMNEFIEHPDVMMHVEPDEEGEWDAYTTNKDWNTVNFSSNPDRTTAIIKCAAKRLGVEL